MATNVRPLRLPALQSPPPSPARLQQQQQPQRQSRPLAPLLSSAPFRRLASRPLLSLRQQTPPSPPNSLLESEHDPIAAAPRNIVMSAATVGPATGAAEMDRTPPASLKERLTRALRSGHKRGESDVSTSTNPGRTIDGHSHRHNASTSTNTSDPISVLSRSRSNSQPFHSLKKQDFCPGPFTSPVRPNSQNHYSLGHGSTRRKYMNGGEVRVEIPRVGRASPETRIYTSLTGEDGSPKPRGNARHSDGVGKMESVTSQDRQYESEASVSNNQAQLSSDRSLAQAESPKIRSSIYSSGHPRSSATAATQSSMGSQDIYLEDVTSSFGFEGLHFGIPEPYMRASPGQFNRRDSGIFGGMQSYPDEDETIYSTDPSSGKASSGVLNNINNIATDGSGISFSSVANRAITPSGTGMERPPYSRNASSTSYVLSRNNSDGQPQETQVRRLSKISSGSVVSGLAILVTADGAASIVDEEEDSDDEVRWTKEEKGKGKAMPSFVSENSLSGKEISDKGNKGPSHTESSASGWSTDTGSESSDHESDEQKLLPGLPKATFGGKKLKGQKADEGVLVHPADARYDFVYRMRQTDDQISILVPQYIYPTTSSFPNRNAFTPPVPAKPIQRYPETSSSPIQRPPNARLTRHYADSLSPIPQGDQAYDSYPESLASISTSMIGSIETKSRSSNDVNSHIHPALRGNSDSEEMRNIRRRGYSMGSLEGISGIGGRPFDSEALDSQQFTPSRFSSQGFESGERSQDFGSGYEPQRSEWFLTGTPGGTGRKRVGSSLANNSDIGTLISIPEQARLAFDEQQPAIELQNITGRNRTSQRQPFRPTLMPRDITPHLYAPRPIGTSHRNLYSIDLEVQKDPAQVALYRKKQTKAGRILLACCLFFPPLLVLIAWGGFDTFMDSITNGNIKEVGKTEKKIAMCAAGILAVGVTAGVAAGIAAAV